MNNNATITPEELLGAVRTLASVDVEKVQAEVAVKKGWAHVLETLDRYAPNWRLKKPPMPDGANRITLAGRAAYAIRSLAQGASATIEQKEKAAGWERIVHTLNIKLAGWREVNGMRLDDRAIAAISKVIDQARAYNDPKAALGAWKITAETLDAIAPGWYPGGGACIATHAANTIKTLHKNAAPSLSNPDGGNFSFWLHVASILNNASPNWNLGGGPADAKALQKIKELADKAKAYDTLMSTLDKQAPRWDDSRSIGISRAEMAAHTISEVFKSREKTDTAATEFRLVTGGTVPAELVDEAIKAAEPCLFKGDGFYMPTPPTPSQWSTYKAALEKLRAAIAKSPAKVVVSRKDATDSSIPFDTSIGKLAYARGWNHLLAEVATQHIINLQTPDNLTDEQCESIYEALHRYGQDTNMNNFGLPQWPDGSHKKAAYSRIRSALGRSKSRAVSRGAVFS